MANFFHRARQVWQLSRFDKSTRYWDERYRLGGNSGAGSYGDVASFKADFMNRFVADNSVETVLELGCGDGAQLSLAAYPRYIGLDVSKTVIARCSESFSSDHSKFFATYQPRDSDVISKFFCADLTLSQDVIYHLVEDDIYTSYMALMFSASRRFSIFFSSDKDEKTRWPHVRHRHFTKYTERNFPGFKLTHVDKNPYQNESCADYYVYERC